MSSIDVLFLHGFAGSPAMWDLVLAGLGEEVHAIRPRLPGHGPQPTGMVSGLEAAVDGLLSSCAERPRVVVGYSMGGRLALSMAARHSGMSALLIGAHPGLSDEQARRERCAWEADQAARLRDEGVAEFMTAWAELPIFATQRELPEALRERQRSWRTEHSAAGLAWAMQTLGLGAMPSYRDRLCGRWLTGARDDKFTRIAQELPVEHRIAADVGHNVVLEAPEVVVDELRRLLADIR